MSNVSDIQALLARDGGVLVRIESSDGEAMDFVVANLLIDANRAAYTLMDGEHVHGFRFTALARDGDEWRAEVGPGVLVIGPLWLQAQRDFAHENKATSDAARPAVQEMFDAL